MNEWGRVGGWVEWMYSKLVCLFVLFVCGVFSLFSSAVTTRKERKETTSLWKKRRRRRRRRRRTRRRRKGWVGRSLCEKTSAFAHKIQPPQAVRPAR